MWVSLCKEDIKWKSKAGRNSNGIKVKKEEEKDFALASHGKEENRKKKDLYKIKRFKFAKLGRYMTQCQRKKSKGASFETKAVLARVEKEVETTNVYAMGAQVPL